MKKISFSFEPEQDQWISGVILGMNAVCDWQELSNLIFTTEKDRNPWISIRGIVSGNPEQIEILRDVLKQAEIESQMI